MFLELCGRRAFDPGWRAELSPDSLVGKVKVAPVVSKETSPFVVDGEDGDEEDIGGNAIAHPNKSPGDLV